VAAQATAKLLKFPRRAASMTLIEKIPTLTDEEVANLLANARRLKDAEDEKRRSAALEILPILEGAFAERRAARLAAAQAKRAANRRPKAKAA
jgi:hypothetical protein